VLVPAAVPECWSAGGNAGGPGTNNGAAALAPLLVAIEAINHGWSSTFSPLLGPEKMHQANRNGWGTRIVKNMKGTSFFRGCMQCFAFDHLDHIHSSFCPFVWLAFFACSCSAGGILFFAHDWLIVHLLWLLDLVAMWLWLLLFSCGHCFLAPIVAFLTAVVGSYDCGLWGHWLIVTAICCFIYLLLDCLLMCL